MRTDSPDNYLGAVENGLRANLVNNKTAYRTFDRFWKDFEYGLKDFPSISEKYRALCKERLQKIWEGE